LGTVEKLQKKNEATQAESGKQIQEIKDLRRRVLQ
jgi:hypothetical protein